MMGWNQFFARWLLLLTKGQIDTGWSCCDRFKKCPFAVKKIATEIFTAPLNSHNYTSALFVICSDWGIHSLPFEMKKRILWWMWFQLRTFHASVIHKNYVHFGNKSLVVIFMKAIILKRSNYTSNVFRRFDYLKQVALVVFTAIYF